MRIALMILTCIVVLSGCAAGDTKMAKVETLMRRYHGAVPGAALLVVRDGVPLVHRGYGLANLEDKTPVTPATNFRLASITKQFTAASILLLAEDGRLHLDDHVRHWLPSLPAIAEPITIRHLLTHTGGLIDYEDIMPPDLATPLRDIDVLHLLETQDHLYFLPGSDYRYSNGGYAMLALIVEQASGQRFQAFLHTRIFARLGMRDTLAYVQEGPPVAQRAYGYTQDESSAAKAGWTRTDQSLTSAVLGDGGIYSSIDDLTRWDAALYDDRLLAAESRRVAFAPHTKTDDPRIEYGYGWRITDDTLWHSGESIGFRNVIVRWPRHKLSVIILSNRNDPEPYSTALAIGRVFLER